MRSPKGFRPRGFSFIFQLLICKNIHFSFLHDSCFYISVFLLWLNDVLTEPRFYIQCKCTFDTPFRTLIFWWYVLSCMASLS